MTESRPHMVLNWHFDIPNQKLSVKITDDLSYEAINGGFDGFYKTYLGETTFIVGDPQDQWFAEKEWLSEHFGHIVGYFQLDWDRVIWNENDQREERCPMGVGPDGLYLDHMQRRQLLLNGKDQSLIGISPISDTLYSTIDNGKTIFKRVAHRNVRYPELRDSAWDHIKWHDHSQPCRQQPWSEGVKLSSYAEMRKDGMPEENVAACEKHSWADSPNPEFQQYYTYPTEDNT